MSLHSMPDSPAADAAADVALAAPSAAEDAATAADPPPADAEDAEAWRSFLLAMPSHEVPAVTDRTITTVSAAFSMEDSQLAVHRNANPQRLQNMADTERSTT